MRREKTKGEAQSPRSARRPGKLTPRAVAPAGQVLVGITPQATQQPGFLIDQVEVVAVEQVQGETGAGLFLPVEQLIGADAVLLAAEHMDRQRQRRALAVAETAAEQEVGAEDRDRVGMRHLPQTEHHQQRQADDLAWLFYSTGTTGDAKGVMLSHGD